MGRAGATIHLVRDSSMLVPSAFRSIRSSGMIQCADETRRWSAPSRILGQLLRGCDRRCDRDENRMPRMFAAQSTQQIVLRMAGGGTITVPRNNVQYTRVSKLSQGFNSCSRYCQVLTVTRRGNTWAIRGDHSGRSGRRAQDCRHRFIVGRGDWRGPSRHIDRGRPENLWSL